ncbi:MAG: protein kinase domain-containing protein, partial [Thermoleophilaceae bacterium]
MGAPLLANRYRVIRRLGAGGMAAVYLAHDERLARDVAVKRMHTAERDDIDARRFQREARLGASLSHPNLVSIFDTDQDDESVLLVMEYVEGETLSDVLARGDVDPRRAMEIVTAVAAALDHAHGAGIVHRDIKPGNVLLGRDGSVKLADLGIAKAVERTDITGTGTVLGTPAYMAPEQLQGG